MLDNMRTGRPASIASQATVINGDLRDGAFVSDVLARVKPDAIMHFAAATIVPESVVKPDLYYGINMVGGYNLLEGARQAGIDKIIVSTAAVYGAPEEIPIKESTATKPVSPYGASKLMFEQMLEAYALAYGTKWIAFRYFNVAGATYEHGEDHRPETHLIPNALLAVAGRRPPLEIYGTDYPTPDGTPIRDYVHVEDLIDAHVLGTAAYRRRFGSVQFGNDIGRERGRRDRRGRSGHRQRSPPHLSRATGRRSADLIADANRARELLGWKPARSTMDQMVGQRLGLDAAESGRIRRLAAAKTMARGIASRVWRHRGSRRSCTTTERVRIANTS